MAEASRAPAGGRVPDAILKAADDPEEVFLSGLELRRRLSISETTLRRYRARGLPSVGGPGVLPRYPLKACLAWLNGQRRPQAPGNGHGA